MIHLSIWKCTTPSYVCRSNGSFLHDWPGWIRWHIRFYKTGRHFSWMCLPKVYIQVELILHLLNDTIFPNSYPNYHNNQYCSIVLDWSDCLGCQLAVLKHGNPIILCRQGSREQSEPLSIVGQLCDTAPILI